ncbi:nuclear transport factor 2 family protein [Haliea sp. E17]|uniref:nuclear transport factor 2 family protein n=1 Tax=Haliea sp. E17 TaxID=3401576 RepID=UPI003AAAA7E4
MILEEMLAREAIRDTMARYTVAGDGLRLADFLAVFTDDAILESEGVPEADRFRYAGKGEIGNWITRWSERARDASSPTHAATFVRHHLATSKIDLLDSEVARARTYWTAWTDIGPDHCGYYLDEFRRCGDAWLIAHRRIRLDWRAPESLFVTAIAHSN